MIRPFYTMLIYDKAILLINYAHKVKLIHYNYEINSYTQNIYKNKKTRIEI